MCMRQTQMFFLVPYDICVSISTTAKEIQTLYSQGKYQYKYQLQQYKYKVWANTLKIPGCDLDDTGCTLEKLFVRRLEFGDERVEMIGCPDTDSNKNTNTNTNKDTNTNRHKMKMQI